MSETTYDWHTLSRASHAHDCLGMLISNKPVFSCGGVYICNRCDGLFGWCTGANDDTPALCDECANFIQDHQ